MTPEILDEMLQEIARLQQHEVGRRMSYAVLLGVLALGEVHRAVNLLDRVVTYYAGPTR